MKNFTLLIVPFLLFLLSFQTSFSQEEFNHSFKITGKERIAIFNGEGLERTVEYDSNSTNHLYITDYTPNGVVAQKTRLLFTGKRFRLTDLGDYFLKKELMKDGIQSTFDENGLIISKMVFKEDTLKKKMFYYEDGRKQVEVEGDRERMNGVFKMWYPNGQLSFSGVYRDNIKDGPFESYDQSGNMERKGVYKKGKLISGGAVVQDFEYTDPDVAAQYIDGSAAFNNYLKKKTSDLEIVKEIPEGDLRILSVKLAINKAGQITKLDLTSIKSESDQQLVKDVFKAPLVFKPALIEEVPVRSVLEISMILSNEGFQAQLHERNGGNKDYGEALNDSTDRVVEEMPIFPGGELALRKFIAYSLRYPVVAQEHGIQGKVYVSFVIDKEGYVRDIKITKSVAPSLDNEAIRVVRKMPRWTPGRSDGKPVDVFFTVPVTFLLQ